ncbi:PIG-L deacetylase family protein [Methanosarcina sp.]|uniref:PIG-L deacetylase family protein n=1 Tax=Methanosarcina sp. TaxID=2213 RepID=UPI003BB7DB15
MKIIAFGAHPDDIEIGVGGVLKKYVDSGNEVLSVIVTIPNNREIRWKEAEKAANILGAEILIMDLESKDIVFSRNLVKEFDSIVNDFKPDIVFTHWNHDSHQDHVGVSNSVIAATRKNECCLYMYEQTVPGGIVPYGFRTQMFVDISNVIDKKIESTLAHESQVKGNIKKWVDGIKGRALYRGSQINVECAEAFEVVRDIKKI